MAAACSTPDSNCKLCPRLAEFRRKNRGLYPDKFNAPVPAFGIADPQLLVVGLAPGLKGANFSGRPFTGDYAGDLLYPTLLKFGFAKGDYGRSIDDGFKLVDARVTNAVRCVPPENKPIGDEINTCRTFLERELAGLSRLKVIVALGGIAHNSVLRALGLPVSTAKFGHKKHYALTPEKSLRHPVLLIDSYHCSRYNVNTRRLTASMFEDVVALARQHCKR
jgi:uracil-DNA glycosylase family 4